MEIQDLNVGVFRNGYLNFPYLESDYDTIRTVIFIIKEIELEKAIFSIILCRSPVLLPDRMR